MKYLKKEILVIGAGPAGLCAAIEARRAGAEVLVVDEKDRPGGQLFKQIHKFFGPAKECAGVRGYRIAQELCRQAEELGVEVLLNCAAYGWFSEGVGLIRDGRAYLVECQRTILASGGSEKCVAFPGSTLPGVLGAGAAQTMVNLHRVLPGRRAVLLGSGNVGLIVAYQLLQAGMEVAAVVECADRITGYGVHAAKLRREGVPIFTGHTVIQALGKNEVEAVKIAAVDAAGNPVPGTERVIAADTLCLAVGLSPMTELAWQAGVTFAYEAERGGFVPMHNAHMETSLPGFYVAGDVAGVSEAYLAMEQGRMAGGFAAASLGKTGTEQGGEDCGKGGTRYA